MHEKEIFLILTVQIRSCSSQNLGNFSEWLSFNLNPDLPEPKAHVLYLTRNFSTSSPQMRGGPTEKENYSYPCPIQHQYPDSVHLRGSPYFRILNKFSGLLQGTAEYEKLYYAAYSGDKDIFLTVVVLGVFST